MSVYDVLLHLGQWLYAVRNSSCRTFSGNDCSKRSVRAFISGQSRMMTIATMLDEAENFARSNVFWNQVRWMSSLLTYKICGQHLKPDADSEIA
jgi:hypothetical protein